MDKVFEEMLAMKASWGGRGQWVDVFKRGKEEEESACVRSYDGG